MDSATDARRSTKKVKCRTNEPPDPDDPVVNEKGIRLDRVGIQPVSWKEKLMGSASIGANVQQEEDFDLDDGDVKAVIIDDNWRTNQPLEIIDLENDYFSVKFQTDEEYLEALASEPCTIVGHCLIMRPWMPAFSTDQPYPSSLLVWIRLPRLPEGMYTKSLLQFIGNAIGTVTKIDRNTDSASRGQFVKLTIFIDLGKSLVSKGCSNSFSNVGKDIGQQPFIMMANGTSENTRHKPNKTVSTDNLTIPIEVAIADLAYGLNKYVEGDMVMVEGDTLSVEMEDEVLTQFIHMRIQVDGNLTPFLCTTIYASHQLNTRHELWNNLEVIATEVVKPWVLVGDFNVVLSCEERLGGQRLKLDHQPILVLASMAKGEEGERPFHLLASWKTHPEFHEVVTKSWRSDVSIIENLETSTKQIKDWNTKFSGNIFSQKRRVLRKLEWVQERRKHNRIEALKIDGSEWCFESEKLRKYAVEYFSKLNEVDDCLLEDYPIQGRFHRIE
ncbi:hypothetical protein GOBAR_DD06554 [Gossypium barbadense]|nr:hypothetical protein GOBAR_DD06554 [Gossypium barbadense]